MYHLIRTVTVHTAVINYIFLRVITGQALENALQTKRVPWQTPEKVK
jgi:hypothetical protein